MTTIKALAGGAALVALVAGAEAKELTYANHLPPAHPVNKAMEKYFADVSEATDGGLTFELFLAGALGGGNALLGILRDGLADTGMLNPVYDPSELKVEALLSELMVADPRVLVGAMNEMVDLHCPACTAELEAVNAVPLMSFAVPSFQLLCNKPLHSLDDAAGTRVRAVGTLSLIATNFGMVPVNLTSDEVYEGLQRGQIDCAAAPFDWLETNSLKEVANELILDPLGAIGGLLHLAVNTNAWNDMSEDEKAAMTGAIGPALADITFSYGAGSKAALETARENGADVYAMGEDMANALDEFRAAEVDRIVAKAEAAGVADAKGLFDTYLGLLDKWEGIVAQTGEDQDAYGQALQDEIFSKL